jgi:ATP-dependent RNA helicase RhlE
VSTEKTFKDLGLGPDLLAAVEAAGWTIPTPIQNQTIPEGITGRDIVGIAQTGTGKTGAFLLSTLESLEAGKGLQLLCLCPTRELAQQVADEAEFLTRGTTLRTEAIYGGVSYDHQNKALAQGFEILVATPGRFIDHQQRGNVDLGNLKVLILDEADRMLDMGFRPQIDEVMRKAPRNRQTMLFSATMPNGVHALALRIANDPLWVEATPEGSVAEGIEEIVYSVRPDKKYDLLAHLLDQPGWDQVLIFTRTKAGADRLQRRLEKGGVTAEAMHSDRQMKHRVRALDRFAEGKVRVLVATDVAQRGLDVEGISHVVNYDVPTDPEDYVHRAGRTGRAGAEGTAVIFMTAAELGYVKALEHKLKRPLEKLHLEEYDYSGAPPTEEEKPERHSRTGGGMGSKKADELSDEELAKLLSFD